MNRVFEEFLLFKAENDGISDRSVRSYRDILVRFETWLDGRDPLAVTGDELLVFTGIYAHKVLGLSPVSRTPYVACIRELYRYLSAVRKLIRANPGEAVSYPRRPGKLPVAMSLDAAQRLMWEPDFETFSGVRDAAMIAVLIGCGLRVGGLVALNVGDLIPQNIDGEARMAIKPREKGAKERLIPVPREADLLLRVYLEHPELATIERTTDAGDHVLFVTTGNRRCPAHEYYGERRRWSVRGVWGMIQRRGRRAGIDPSQLHPHAIRHLFGTELAESDMDLLERQRLMGHADPKTTAIYTAMAVRKLARGVDRSNPLAKVSTPASQLLEQMGRKR